MTTKFHANFKTLTITQDEYNKNSHEDIIKGFVIVDVIYHGDLVTLIYQTQYIVTEFNLSRMSKDELIYLAKINEIPLKSSKVVNSPMTKQDILKLIDQEEKDAESESKAKYWEVKEKWGFIRSNLDSLFSDSSKHRKEVFFNRGIPFYKKARKLVAKNKQQLIQSLLESSASIYECYGYYIA